MIDGTKMYFMGTFRLPELSVLRKRNKDQVGGESESREIDSAPFSIFIGHV